MKKGKKMPSIELEGQSEAQFVLRDGKIVRVENDRHTGSESRSPEGPESRGPNYPGS